MVGASRLRGSAPFWSSTLSTLLLGVVIGAGLTWAVTRHVQKQDLEDRYSERFDARNVIWMDALDRYAETILEDVQQSHSVDSYWASDRVEDAFSQFWLRIRQAGLVAKRKDHEVLEAIESAGATALRVRSVRGDST
jgi:nitrogen regulatory protein PII